VAQQDVTKKGDGDFPIPDFLKRIFLLQSTNEEQGHLSLSLDKLFMCDAKY